MQTLKKDRKVLLSELIKNKDNLLKVRRQSLGLTQQHLADLAELKLSMIADIESGRQHPNETTARVLDKVLKDAEAEFKHKTAKTIFVLTRNEKGLSQEQVAREAKIDLAVYSKWEAGMASLDDAAVFRVQDAINQLSEKSKSAVNSSTNILLSSLMGTRDAVYEVWTAENKKEGERVVNALTARALIKDVELLEEQAGKVPALESENAALKAQIADLQKTIRALKNPKEEVRRQHKRRTKDGDA